MQTYSYVNSIRRSLKFSWFLLLEIIQPLFLKEQFNKKLCERNIGKQSTSLLLFIQLGSRTSLQIFYHKFTFLIPMKDSVVWIRISRCFPVSWVVTNFLLDFQKFSAHFSGFPRTISKICSFREFAQLFANFSSFPWTISKFFLSFLKFSKAFAIIFKLFLKFSRVFECFSWVFASSPQVIRWIVPSSNPPTLVHILVHS